MTPADPAAIQRELLAAAAHDPALPQFASAISAHQYNRAYQLVLRHLPTGGTVLDWGAGNGHFSYFLIRAGYRAAGFDLGPAPRLCQAFSPHAYTYRQAAPDEPSALPFAAASFDGVASIGVLEHVRETGGDEAASLREIARVLRPGGVFLCYHLPNRYSWIEFGLRRLGRWSHQFRYTQAELTALLRAAGLQWVAGGRYGALPRNLWRGPLGRSERAAQAYDILDAVLGVPLNPLCQNYWAVARKA